MSEFICPGPGHIFPLRRLFNVKDPINTFRGRRADLQKIHHSTLEQGQSILIYIKVIVGLPGIGKTETIRAYIREYRACYDNIIWINAQTLHSIKSSFLDLAQNFFHIPAQPPNGKPKDFSRLLDQIYQKLLLTRTLLIFDDVEQFRPNNLNEDLGSVFPFLPQSDRIPLQNLVILVTSRNVLDWSPIKPENVITLHPFTAEESLSLIFEQLTLKDSEKSVALELANFFGRHPSILQQVITFIKNDIKNSTTPPSKKVLRKYLDNFVDLHLKYQLLNFPPTHDSSNFCTLLNRTLVQINNVHRGAIEIIQTLSLFHPVPVPTQFLCEVLGIDTDLLEESIIPLKRYGFVHVQMYMRGADLSMDGTIQSVILVSLEMTGELSSMIASVLAQCDRILNQMNPLTNYLFEAAFKCVQSLTDKYHLTSPQRDQVHCRDEFGVKFSHRHADLPLKQMIQFSKDNEKIQFLGKGGFGIVWHGQNKMSQVDCALKVICLYPESKKQSENRMREVEILKTIHDYPADPRQHYILKSEGSFLLTVEEVRKSKCKKWIQEEWFGKDIRPPISILFIKMEYCTEGNLEVWLRDPKRNRGERQGRLWIVQLAEGLSYLHEKNIIHRDVKPANILLTKVERGEEVIAKIGDFGVSRVRIPGAKTELTMGIGTDPYHAPEILYAKKSFDGESDEYTTQVDIFSMGLVVFFIHYPMKNGENPELNKYYAIFKDFKDGTKFPREFNQKFDGEYEFTGILSEMLEVNPEKRPSAAKVARVFKDIQRVTDADENMDMSPTNSPQIQQ